MPASPHPLAARTVAAVVLATGLSACASLGTPYGTLTEADFRTIEPGIRSEQVLARFGRPNWAFGVRQENLTIWNYRFNRNDCVIYQVSIRPDGTVKDAAPGYDPACDGPSGRF